MCWAVCLGCTGLPAGEGLGCLPGMYWAVCLGRTGMYWAVCLGRALSTASSLYFMDSLNLVKDKGKGGIGNVIEIVWGHVTFFQCKVRYAQRRSLE